MAIASVNPATNETLKTFEPFDAATIERKLALAAAAFARDRKTTIGDRAVWLRAAADVLEKDKRRYAELAVLEMGKPIRQAVSEIEKCAWVCRYYADNAATMLADERIATDASDSYVRFDPLGVVLAVMPWNFPYWQVLRFAAPAIAAGNVCLLKHASNVPQCALAIEEIFTRGGAPTGAFQTLLIGAAAAESIIDDERVAAVTLTGSEPAGSSVAARAAKHIKKAVLELGGSDPFIVTRSADVDAAVSTAVAARTINNGQSCIAAKRFIVDAAVAQAFERGMAAKFEQLVIGDPMDEKTEIGPLVNFDAVRGLDDQVQRLVKSGGRLVTGGKPLDRKGCYYPPTIVADVDPAWPIAREEFFGPVALLFRVGSLAEAVGVANSTTFGLGASAWTRDDAEREALVRGIDAGAVFINGMVKSDPRLPFGGVKHSGYGRELGVLGIREFVNAKTVWIGPAKA